MSSPSHTCHRLRQSPLRTVVVAGMSPSPGPLEQAYGRPGGQAPCHLPHVHQLAGHSCHPAWQAPPVQGQQQWLPFIDGLQSIAAVKRAFCQHRVLSVQK